MNEPICKWHNIAKTLYCADCRVAICHKCPSPGTCKVDHKKADLPLAAKQFQIEREKNVDEMVRILSEVVDIESNITKYSSKLKDLENPEYQEIFDSMDNIFDKIGNIKKNKLKLPQEAFKYQEQIKICKDTLIENLTAAKNQIKETKISIENKDFYGVLAAKPLEIPNISDATQAFMEIKLDIKEFLNSIKNFKESFEIV